MTREENKKLILYQEKLFYQKFVYRCRTEIGQATYRAGGMFDRQKILVERVFAESFSEAVTEYNSIERERGFIGNLISIERLSEEPTGLRFVPLEDVFFLNNDISFANTRKWGDEYFHELMQEYFHHYERKLDANGLYVPADMGVSAGRIILANSK